LHRHISSASCSEYTKRFIIQDQAVRVIIYDEKTIFSREINKLLQLSHARYSTGRHVREIHPHQLHATKIAASKFSDVNSPVAIFFQIICDHLCTDKISNR